MTHNQNSSYIDKCYMCNIRNINESKKEIELGRIIEVKFLVLNN